MHSLSTRSPIGRFPSLVVVIASLASMTLAMTSSNVVATGTSSIGGLVFEDKDVDGNLDLGEPGVAGVEVKVYDSAGAAVGTALTDGSGSYSVSVPSIGNYRVEFGKVDGYVTSVVGGDNKTSIQFVVAPATSVRYAVQRPGDYCANMNLDPQIVTACIVPSQPSDPLVSAGPTLRKTSWSNPGSPTTVQTHAITGATWGVAPHPVSGLVFQSAVIRRHAGLGPQGIGGIYVTNPSTGALVTSFDLTSLGIVLHDPADDFSNSARGIAAYAPAYSEAPLSIDELGYEAVGKAGIGDIEISSDGKFLWLVNLYEKKVHRVEIVGTLESPTLGAVTSYSIPQAQCPGTTARPWGLKPSKSNGQLMVGVVCTNEELPVVGEATVGRATLSSVSTTSESNRVVFSVGVDTNWGWTLDANSNLVPSWNGDRPIDCSTLSTTIGVDFIVQNISTIDSIKQLNSRTCLISATATATSGGPTVLAKLGQTPWFSMYATGSDSATKVITVPGDYATGSRFASVGVTVPATPTALTVTLSGLSVYSANTGLLQSIIYSGSGQNDTSASLDCSTISTTMGIDLSVTNIAEIIAVGQRDINECRVLMRASAAGTATITGGSSVGISDFSGRTATSISGTPKTATATLTADTTAPTVALSRAASQAPTSERRHIDFTITASGAEELDCSTLSTTNGVDFSFTNIVKIVSIVQSNQAYDNTNLPSGTSSGSRLPKIEYPYHPVVCTIHAISGLSSGVAGTARLNLAPTFSMSDRAGNVTTTATVAAGANEVSISGSAGHRPLSPSGGAKILGLTPAGSGSWSVVGSVNLDYVRESDYCRFANQVDDASVACETARWHGWTDDFAVIRSNSTDGTGGQSGPIYMENQPFAEGDIHWFPQPMFTGIEILADGSIVASFADRLSYQLGFRNLAPDESNPNSPVRRLIGGRVQGDTLMLCARASTLVQEVDGSCQTDTTTRVTSASPSAVNSTSPWGEFFHDYMMSGASIGSHRELTVGAVAVWPESGAQKVAVTSMDPADSIFTNGVRWYNTENGTKTSAVEMVGMSAASGFMKAASMGDLELLCNMAPVQIGNRVWLDSDRDGVQDAGEDPIAGVTVRLYNSLGALVGTSITDARGDYYFTSTVSEAADGGSTPDNSGGGLLPNAAYTIKFNKKSDYLSGGPLFGMTMTSPDVNDPTTSLDDSVDSDATFVAGLPVIAVPPRLPGQNDHTFDAGFHVDPNPCCLTAQGATVGNRVWFDSNRNGLQDNGEPGMGDVFVGLYDPNFNLVSDVWGSVVGFQRTDSNGNYIFSELPPGTYKVMVLYPSGFQPTTAGVGSDPSIDSSTFTADSAFVPAGSSDLTLDFGVVGAKVKVGSFVWVDADSDGVQDQGESGLAGAVLTLTDMSGNPVTDIFGRTVATQTTSSTGEYLFDFLPLGQYKVNITYPTGYVATTAGAGSDRAVDSSTNTATSVNLPNDGDADLTLDFGVVPPAKVSVGNFVWVDADADGVQDQGESGLAGAVLSLTDMSGNPVTNVFGQSVASQTTASDGAYSFVNLPPGQYKVNITYPTGYVATTAGAGSDRAVDSSTGTATSVNLPSNGDADLTLDFGVIVSSPAPTTTTTTTVPSNLPTTTSPSSGPSNSPTTSPSSGPSNSPTTTLPTLPTVPTPSNNGSAVLPGYPGTFDGGSGFGSNATGGPVWQGSNLSPSTLGVSVGGVVWIDSRRDGRQSADEPTLAGVVLYIVDSRGRPAKTVNGATVPEVTTDATGHYLFTNLRPGTYRVQIRSVAGFVPTLSGVGSRMGDSSNGSASSSNLSRDGSFDVTLDFGFVYAQQLPATGGRSGMTLLVATILVSIGFVVSRSRRYPRRA